MNNINPNVIQHPDCCSVAVDEPSGLQVTFLATKTMNLQSEVKGAKAIRPDKLELRGPRELPKCNNRAAALRRIGNQHYAQKQFKEALIKYNESICAATADSEDLGMGYANRSAFYVENYAYGMALADIALAKKHNYPERLMPKLLTREATCRSHRDDNDPDDKNNGPLSYAVNVEVNPRIPFLAKGIRARHHPIQGHVMVAERNFKVGDVILHEKPLRVCVGSNILYLRCNNCFSKNIGHLLPCPNCAAAMFCNEECMREGYQLHRFECGISSELSRQGEMWLGPRMFFHGLSLFDDDIGKMMEFCASAKGTKGSFCNVDYTDYNALEEFRQFLMMKSRRPEDKSDENRLRIFQYKAAAFLAMYMKNPLVQSLLASKEQEDFMLQSFLDYQLITHGLSVLHNASCLVFPVTSGFAHSCDPKISAVPYGASLTMVVIRPINRGEQMDISYGPMCDQESKERAEQLQDLGFRCICDFCDGKKRQRWLAKFNQESTIDLSYWTVLHRVLQKDDATKVDRQNALQQFIQRFASHYPQKQFAVMVKSYRELLAAYYAKDYQNARIRKVAAGVYA